VAVPYGIWFYHSSLDQVLLDWVGAAMTKNPSPTSSKNPVVPEKRFSIDLLAFKAGLQAPSVPEFFLSVQSWEVTADNTLIIREEGFIYVCPSGMWQSITVRELD
jgi:hypothetical protein